MAAKRFLIGAIWSDETAGWVFFTAISEVAAPSVLGLVLNNRNVITPIHKGSNLLLVSL